VASSMSTQAQAGGGQGSHAGFWALVLSFHTCTFTRKPQPELMEKILAKGHFGQFGGMEVS
jgi:hypothetical protein